MTMQTPAEILELAEPIEDIYARMVDELLINIGKHLRNGSAVWTAYWEVEKLAELGQLTAENAAIINKHIKALPEKVWKTLDETRVGALYELEARLEEAAEAGFLTPPTTDKVTQVLRELAAQAESRYNLTNTNMLQSSMDMYRHGVADVVERMERTLAELNQASANLVEGTDTMRNAVRSAILNISAKGLTGFYDRAGREWTPEAYVNMVTRTTVHNTAIQSYKMRAQEYGANVFQVSEHPGARPLCYPWQGKFLSWDNTSGTIRLGDGRTVSYAPLNSTSYGQPAGLFGINCQHFPQTIIPGVTIPTVKSVQNKEANDALYALKQEQRRLERYIRYAKRDLVMLGDTATKEDRQRVRDAQADMRDFVRRTGFRRQYQNEQIVKEAVKKKGS